MSKKELYRFLNYPLLWVDEDGQLYQDAHESFRRYYPERVIKPKLQKVTDKEEKFYISGKWVSKKKLNDCAYPVANLRKKVIVFK